MFVRLVEKLRLKKSEQIQPHLKQVRLGSVRLGCTIHFLKLGSFEYGWMSPDNLTLGDRRTAEHINTDIVIWEVSSSVIYV